MYYPKPELNREEAMDLYFTERSAYAQEQAFLANVRLVPFVMKRYGLNPMDDDLFQTGALGLVKALQKFDPDKRIEFSTFAAPLIRNAILMSIRKKQPEASCSLDAEVPGTDGALYADMLPDVRCAEDEVIAKVRAEDFLSGVEERDRDVLALLMSGKSQAETGKALGISQAQVSRTLTKLRKSYGR